MQFKDDSEKADFEFMLNNSFIHVSAGVRTTGDFAGEAYDEFWFRDCILHDGDWHGTQGYLMVWWNEKRFVTHHTYHDPREIYL